MLLSPTSDLSKYRDPWPGLVDVTGYPIIASARGRVFHNPAAECSQRIFASNLVVFGSYDDAVNSGRKPCNECKPQP